MDCMYMGEDKLEYTIAIVCCIKKQEETPREIII